MSRKMRFQVAWFLMGLGALFLLAGLVVLVFASMPRALQAPMAPNAPAAPSPSFVVALADLITRFVLALLQVEWTPARIGVFLISVGLLLEAAGLYVFSTASRARR